MPHTAGADRSHTAADTPCPAQQPAAAKLSPITCQSGGPARLQKAPMESLRQVSPWHCRAAITLYLVPGTGSQYSVVLGTGKSMLSSSYHRCHCFVYLIPTKAEGMPLLRSAWAWFTVTAKEVRPSMIRIRGHNRGRRAQTQQEARTQTSFDG